MIWGYHYFWKHPYTVEVNQTKWLAFWMILLVHNVGPREYLYMHCIQSMTECPCFPSRGSDLPLGSAYSSQPPARIYDGISVRRLMKYDTRETTGGRNVPKRSSKDGLLKKIDHDINFNKPESERKLSVRHFRIDR